MTRIAGLASNRGRNLLHIDDERPGGASLAVVLSDHDDAPVLEAAADRGIPTETVERRDGEAREAHDRRLVDALAGYDLDLVCLDGYMRILSPEFLDKVPPTLNVHPSLLPAFPGDDAHEQVLDAGVRVTGCTVHVVTETVDDGPIVTQEVVPVYDDDDAAALKRRVLHDAEFAAYPRAIRWFAADRVRIDDGVGTGGPTVSIEGDEAGDFPERRVVSGDRVSELRYGENPHQAAAVYADAGSEATGVVDVPQLNAGAKALSYNNYNDADAALNLIREFDGPAAAVIKHTNPAGCATADTLADAYADALATDAMSAFGGIVGLNRPCDADTAERIVDSFKEVVVAPGYTDAAVEILADEDDLRVLDVGDLDGDVADRLTEKRLAGGRLVQERDGWAPTREDLEVVTETAPTDEQVETMLFAWKVLKHVKSNGIVLADGTETVGVGAGQVSRVDAVRLATMKADEHAEGKDVEGTVLASDAFFPFPDGVERAADAGVEAVIQPGGSVNDDDVIAACNDRGMPMAFTGRRCFRHD
ncbi:phosphoribosylglycinamide formyltransferase [Halobellus ruber]|uniref:phosphoribosylglycinamide formyltransferase 1 n=1 Tax=Halobellus ruber TaxID=2761102 RepID=A0A7J9SN84_9EURY|nr:phosphoribosylglycinamide formyltransferase [Halobellus ruber]MBB6647669.1 phosphoribosylglycinamide formyltransferase [Halobellus ruber]